MQSVRSGSILVAAMALVLAACTGPDTLTDPATQFTATLTGAQEVPAVTTAAKGTASINSTSGDYTVTYTGLSGDATMAHVHLGNAGATGAASVTLCDGTCPTGAAASITGNASFTAALTAMRTFGAYVNVHSAAHTGGEIRGQIFGVY